MTFFKTSVKLDMVLNGTGVVIPAFNASKTLGPIIKNLLDYGFNKENIILVDDGSEDKTSDVGLSYGVEVIRIERNTGKGFALNLGFQKAMSKGLKKVFTLDADGQHLVEEMEKFSDYSDISDIIIGNRNNNYQAMPFIRKVVNRITSLVISLLSKKYIPDVQSGYRLINLEVFKKIKLKTKNFQTESELVYRAIKNGYRINFVPITTIYNNSKSYILPVLDTVRFINMAVRFLWG